MKIRWKDKKNSKTLNDSKKRLKFPWFPKAEDALFFVVQANKRIKNAYNGEMIISQAKSFNKSIAKQKLKLLNKSYFKE